MRVWILQTGEPLHCDAGNPRPMRAMNLANALVERGHYVVIWSSAFYHQEKMHRSRSQTTIKISNLLEIRLIPSCGYDRNVGIERLKDHFQMARNLKTALVDQSHPDVIFVGYPPIETSAVMTRWSRQRDIPTVVDVKDQWPHYFLGAVPSITRPLFRILLAPYFYLGRRALRDASGLTSMSKSFLEWAAEFRGSPVGPNDGIFSLTAPGSKCVEADLVSASRWWDDQGVKLDTRFRVMFVGSFASSFDFAAITTAARKLLVLNLDIEFILCGDGQDATKLRELASDLSNVRVFEWIDRPKIETLAKRCVAMIAPYRNVENFTMNLPNKILDGLSLGLPILTSLDGEVESLITEHSVGMRYGEPPSPSLMDCVIRLYRDRDLLESLSSNAKALYEREFRNDYVYGRMSDFLIGLIK